MENSTKNDVFIRLYSGIQNKLRTFIWACIHNQAHAEDVLQETAVVLWGKFEEYDHNCDFEAWAIGIAKMKILEFLRKNRRTKKLFRQEVYTRLLEMAKKASDNDVGDRIEIMNTCIKKLNPSDQKLLQIRYKNGESIKKMSKITGHSSDGLYKTLSRIIYTVRLCVKRTMLQGEHRA